MTVNATDYLKVEGANITLHGKPIILKGAGLGGWMNMENFITGYPGHECASNLEAKDVAIDITQFKSVQPSRRR